MAISKVYTGTAVGLEPTLVTVEVNVEKKGFPSFKIVGLPGKEVDESKLRIRSAIKNSEFQFPKNKITVNLAPANVRKEGSLYDLPIAIGILKATNQITADLEEKLFMGELSLDGKIKKTRGAAVIGNLSKREDINYLYIPENNKKEVFFVKNSFIKLADRLKGLVKHLQGIKLIRNYSGDIKLEETEYDVLYGDIKGQKHAKRGMEIAAAGGHNISLTGPPGTGKSMLAKAMQSILPPLSQKEKEEVIRIRSILNKVKGEEEIKRPFRSPHHTISKVGLTGGGTKIKPGEITMAHRGILFMDEFNEFSRDVLEALRQPLEDNEVTISRASGTLSFPASFSLVASNNPCPCGYLTSELRECECKHHEVRRYQKKISGPIWDRIDLYVTMKEFELKEMSEGSNQRAKKDTKEVRENVTKAREIQRKRYKEEEFKTNAEQSNKTLMEYINITDRAKSLIDTSWKELGISPRGYYKILKVSRTVADLEGDKKVNKEHVSEALGYRNRPEVVS